MKFGLHPRYYPGDLLSGMMMNFEFKSRPVIVLKDHVHQKYGAPYVVCLTSEGTKLYVHGELKPYDEHDLF